MPFTLPVFNCTSNVWHYGNATTNPPDLSPDCQLYVNSRGLLDITPGEKTLWVPPIFYRTATGTDIRVDDTIEVNAGEGKFYLVRWVETVHKNFPNEYLMAIIEQLPIPTPPAPTGVSPVYFTYTSGNNVATSFAPFDIQITGVLILFTVCVGPGNIFATVTVNGGSPVSALTSATVYDSFADFATTEVFVIPVVAGDVVTVDGSADPVGIVDCVGFNFATTGGQDHWTNNAGNYPDFVLDTGFPNTAANNISAACGIQFQSGSPATFTPWSVNTTGGISSIITSDDGSTWQFSATWATTTAGFTPNVVYNMGTVGQQGCGCIVNVTL